MEQESQYQGPERRRSPRKKVISAVEYTILGEPQGAGISKNLSESGFCFLLEQYMPPGVILKIRFNLPQNEEQIPIEAVGKVVWVEETEGGYLTGLQFLT